MNKDLRNKCSNGFCDDWEWNLLQEEFYRENVKDNWNYCDIGSCQGRFTNLFKELCKPSGIVYAFDINNKNPKIDGCFFERIAISNVDGIERVFDSGTHMSNILGYDVGHTKSPFLYEINSIRLDTYFKDLRIDCIKMDIEGAELKAIQGGIETIKKCSLVTIECHLDEDWPEIYEIFRENNLQFRDLLTDELVTISKKPYQIYFKK